MEKSIEMIQPESKEWAQLANKNCNRCFGRGYVKVAPVGAYYTYRRKCDCVLKREKKDA
jgi:hypothetical protein